MREPGVSTQGQRQTMLANTLLRNYFEGVCTAHFDSRFYRLQQGTGGSAADRLVHSPWLSAEIEKSCYLTREFMDD
ncbi:hypothetical protein JW905_10385 [bacterium]|nr:hypothetical protein [candidate division CSSED10-310 bacterium]